MSESKEYDVEGIRHGDVILVKVGNLPGTEMKEVAPDNGRTVLAYGEVTGHSHALPNQNAKLSKTAYNSAVKNVLASKLKEVSHAESCIKANGDSVEFLSVGKGGARLSHDEHPPVVVDEGCYVVIHQQEYSPGEVKQVRD
jgi:hypothetical protein